MRDLRLATRPLVLVISATALFSMAACVSSMVPTVESATKPLEKQPSAASRPLVTIGSAKIYRDGFSPEHTAAFDSAPLCHMNLTRPLPISDTRLMLGGNMSCDFGIARSVMLQSDDGGVTWTERGESITGSEVNWIIFVTPSVGYAVASWFVEGPGPEIIFRTSDSGTTWTRVGEVPKGKNVSLSVLRSLSFTSPEHGVADIWHTVSSGEEVSVRFVTEDGAKSWRFVEVVSAQTPPPDTTTIRTFDVLETNLKFKWQLQEQEGQWIVSQTDKTGSPWKNISLIPTMTLIAEPGGGITPQAL